MQFFDFDRARDGNREGSESMWLPLSRLWEYLRHARAIRFLICVGLNLC